MALVLRLLGLSDELLNDFISLWFTGCMAANSVNSILFVTSEWTDPCNPTIYLCYLYIQILRSNSWLLDFASCLLRCTMLNLQIYHLLLFVLLFVVIQYKICMRMPLVLSSCCVYHVSLPHLKFWASYATECNHSIAVQVRIDLNFWGKYSLVLGSSSYWL